MTGTDLAIREPAAVQLTNGQLEYIASTEFVPRGLRGNLPAIMACVVTGRALGIDDMEALRQIHVVDGRPTFSAELMVKLARRYGHSITGEVGPQTATVTGKRADNGDSMTVTWTLEMAERAGLAGKQNWRKYPEAMLWARAVSQLCRMLFADCFAGGTYTPDELEDVAGGSASGSGASPTSRGALAEGDEAVTEADRLAASDPVVGTPFDDWEDVDASPAEPVREATAAQKRKLNLLVGTLRDKGVIDTDQVYDAAGVATDHVWARDENNTLRWSPLRDRLTKPQAHRLIDWLEPLSALAEYAEQAGAMETLIEKVRENRESRSWDLHVGWLRGQAERIQEDAA